MSYPSKGLGVSGRRSSGGSDSSLSDPSYNDFSNYHQNRGQKYPKLTENDPQLVRATQGPPPRNTGNDPDLQWDHPVGIDNPSYEDMGDEFRGHEEYRSTNRYQNNNNPPLPNGHIPSTTKPRARVRHKGRGKKLPLTPTPLPPSHSYNIPYGDPDSAVISTSPGGKMHLNTLPNEAKYSGDDDRDLVDYDDYGSSTSTSTSSGNCSEDEDSNANSSLAQDYPNNNKNNEYNLNTANSKHVSNKDSSSRSKTDYSKFNGNWERNSSLYERTLRGTSGGDFDEGPCSSSSLREPPTVHLVKSGVNKVSAIGSSTSTSKSNGDQSAVSTSLRKSESRSSILVDEGSADVVAEDKSDTLSRHTSVGALEHEFDPRNPKYAFSGVGRHFGRRSTSSLLDLSTEDAPVPEPPKGFFHGIDVFGYLTRLKAVSIVFLATLFILSSSSLLFVFPIIIDPILLGMEAQFSIKPVQCRTSNFRNGTGASECVVPSCREGCTADLYSCFYIEVEYEVDPVVQSQIFLNPDKEATNERTFNGSNDDRLNSQDNLRRGTLLININGCGYPPDVNCSVFEKTYGKVDSVFPCFYSQVNESIVVPYYNYRAEKRHLIIGLCVPFGLAIFSALALALLLKCRGTCGLTRNRTVSKNSSSLKLLPDGDVESVNVHDMGHVTKLNGTSAKTSDNNHHQINGLGPKSNGHTMGLEEAMGGLLGMKSPGAIRNSIKKLPHQHDSFDKSVPYLNGAIAKNYSGTGSPRKSRYAKKSKKFFGRSQSIEEAKGPRNNIPRANEPSSEDEL